VNARRVRPRSGEFVVITGLSGAGRTQAANVLEDLGWFVIDNLPAALIDKVADLARAPGTSIERIALVAGARDVAELTAGLAHLRSKAERVRVLFLEAADEVLIRRFEDTRRRHPFEDDGGLVNAITREREALEPLKGEADVVVDTSGLNVHQLRERIESLFEVDQASGGIQTAVVSFGYKHGLPLDVDIVLDCRFLPNPHWVDELRPHTGRHSEVRDYVLSFPESADFLEKIDSLFELLLPAYVAEGKSYLTIAMGCTGGHHRSVVMAEEVARLLRARGFEPRVTHRDIDR
jgi:RNase adapter protein RapZ